MMHAVRAICMHTRPPLAKHTMAHQTTRSSSAGASRASAATRSIAESEFVAVGSGSEADADRLGRRADRKASLATRPIGRPSSRARKAPRLQPAGSVSRAWKAAGSERNPPAGSRAAAIASPRRRLGANGGQHVGGGAVAEPARGERRRKRRRHRHGGAQHRSEPVGRRRIRGGDIGDAQCRRQAFGEARRHDRSARRQRGERGRRRMRQRAIGVVLDDRRPVPARPPLTSAARRSGGKVIVVGLASVGFR